MPSIIAQIQSLISACSGKDLRLQLDIFAGPQLRPPSLSLSGFLPYPPRRWQTLWFPTARSALACASLALASASRGLFIGHSLTPSGSPSPWLSLLIPGPDAALSDSSNHPYVWHTTVSPVPPLPLLTAVFFDAGFETQRRAIYSAPAWLPQDFPLKTLPWFDAIPFPRQLAPPFPLLLEELIPPPSPPPPARFSRPTAHFRSPDWLKPALPPSRVPFPQHDPASPHLHAFQKHLDSFPLPSPALQAHFLYSLRHGFGSVIPTGSHSHRSHPANSPATIPHMPVIRAKFLALTTTAPPQCYGPFTSRPPFPRTHGGPQPIISPLGITFKGEGWSQAIPMLTPGDRLIPGYANATGSGKPRVTQNASAPRPDRRHHRFSGWALNERVFGPSIRQCFSSQRTIAELLAWFGPGTRVLQTDFPSAYKLNRLPLDSLFAHCSSTVTPEFGVEFWVDGAGIFGSGQAPESFELFVIPFEHIVRHSSPSLVFTFHFVDNLFSFLPTFLLGPDPNLTISQAERSLHAVFDSFPTPHHDDHSDDPFPGLGFIWSSRPSPAAGLKPAKAAILRAILTHIGSETPLPASLAESVQGLIIWLAQSLLGFSPLIPHLLEYHIAARVAAPALAPISPGFASAARATLRSFPQLRPGTEALLSPPSVQLRIHPLIRPSPRFAAVLRSDASPHFGIGGFSLSSLRAFHGSWAHPPHSAEADSISSTLAEAVAAFFLFRHCGVPGLNLLQTDSDPLFHAFSKGYSPHLPIHEIIQLILSHARSIQADLMLLQILRASNQVADALASNQPPSSIAPLLLKEIGSPQPLVMFPVACPSSFLDSIRSPNPSVLPRISP